jgi:hypothetical protein
MYPGAPPGSRPRRQSAVPDAFVEQIDGKRAELGQTCDELRDLDQQLFEIEDRRDLAAQLEERGE